MRVRPIQRISGTLAAARAACFLSFITLGAALGDGPGERTALEQGGSKTTMAEQYQRARRTLAELDAAWARSKADAAALRPLVERLRKEIEVLREPGSSVAVAKGPPQASVEARGSVVTLEEFESRARALRGTGLPTRARGAPPVRKDRPPLGAEWLAERARSAERVLIEMQTILEAPEGLRRPDDQKAFKALLDALGVILDRAGRPPG
jgi:hypothetical protein